MKKIITITTGRPFEFKQFGIKAIPGVNEVEVSEENFESLKKVVEKNAFFKREALRKGGIKVAFKELTQSEIDEQFEETQKALEAEGKHVDLASLGLDELRTVYTQVTGEEAGKKSAKTLRKEIIEAREETEGSKNE